MARCAFVRALTAVFFPRTSSCRRKPGCGVPRCVGGAGGGGVEEQRREGPGEVPRLGRLHRAARQPLRRLVVVQVRPRHDAPVGRAHVRRAARARRAAHAAARPGDAAPRAEPAVRRALERVARRPAAGQHVVRRPDLCARLPLSPHAVGERVQHVLQHALRRGGRLEQEPFYLRHRARGRRHRQPAHAEPLHRPRHLRHHLAGLLPPLPRRVLLRQRRPAAPDVPTLLLPLMLRRREAEELPRADHVLRHRRHTHHQQQLHVLPRHIPRARRDVHAHRRVLARVQREAEGDRAARAVHRDVRRPLVRVRPLRQVVCEVHHPLPRRGDDDGRVAHAQRDEGGVALGGRREHGLERGRHVVHHEGRLDPQLRRVDHVDAHGVERRRAREEAQRVGLGAREHAQGDEEEHEHGERHRADEHRRDEDVACAIGPRPLRAVGGHETEAEHPSVPVEMAALFHRVSLSDGGGVGSVREDERRRGLRTVQVRGFINREGPVELGAVDDGEKLRVVGVQGKVHDRADKAPRVAPVGVPVSNRRVAQGGVVREVGVVGPDHCAMNQRDHSRSKPGKKGRAEELAARTVDQPFQFRPHVRPRQPVYTGDIGGPGEVVHHPRLDRVRPVTERGLPRDCRQAVVRAKGHRTGGARLQGRLEALRAVVGPVACGLERRGRGDEPREKLSGTEPLGQLTVEVAGHCLRLGGRALAVVAPSGGGALGQDGHRHAEAHSDNRDVHEGEARRRGGVLDSVQK
mmetsp:Transcript_17254/g.53574  ORF Transcript_17254/g.53574 Transcript_17254/m.53574 type:complete len:746 (-) Transcript_17254:131-2368(-)